MDGVREQQPGIHVSRSECCTKLDLVTDAWIFSPLHFVVVNYKLLFQNFDCVKAIRLLFFSKHDLSEVALSEDGQKVKII